MLLLLSVLCTGLAAEPKFEPLFNGRDLTGWSAPNKEKFWRVEDGVLIGENDEKLAGSYLWTAREYGDFILEFEVRWVGEIDSGVEMRKPNMQLQLGVSRSLKRDMTGSFYVGTPVRYPEAGQAKDIARQMHPEGQWNTFRLKAKGTEFTVWVNGQPASHYVDEKFAGAAPLGLQIHPGLKMRVEYRNLRIAALESAPCVFCEIVSGARPGAMVYQDDRCVAFLSIGPRNPGHVLVVPRGHATTFSEVPEETMHAMTDATRRIVGAIGRTDLKMEGYVLQLNSGKAAGQSVPHAHLHIIPRFAGEPPAKVPEDRVSLDELEPVAAKIRAALADGTPAASRPAFVLPPLGEEVPLPKIREICEHYGLHELWQKIEQDPPSRPFKSDGCTGWFDDWKGVSLYPAGFLHDLKYWAGYPGEDVARLQADSELMLDVARLLGSTEMAETMFHGVRVGGTEKLKTPFSWGFGRKPPESK
ncbi:MAG TPA: family 16 glycoside hydrolase [Lacunisphaera sp.]|nr:family 16 glycoside hydrolase [Lacunisphaera sp.]